MIHVLIVAAGGAIGAAARHLVNLLTLRIIGSGFPAGTLAINVVGALLMGLFIAWLSRRTGGASAELRLFVATGILGGFTTFSAFSLEFLVLWERGSIGQAAFYVAASVIGSLVAVFAGFWLARGAS